MSAAQRLERRLFAMGVPIMASPIREALDAAYAQAREEGRREAEADAARYRWMRDELSPEDFAVIPAEELDAFIDAEMAR